VAVIIYFGMISTIYALTYTMFVVPYTALGFELTDDYDERTKVMSWRMYIGLIAGLCIPNLYVWCQSDVFGGDILTGARWVTAFVGLSVLITGCLPALLCREKVAAKPQSKIKLGKAILETIKDKSFRLLLSGYVRHARMRAVQYNALPFKGYRSGSIETIVEFIMWEYRAKILEYIYGEGFRCLRQYAIGMISKNNSVMDTGDSNSYLIF
jgi:hypothetical protein